MRQYLFDEDLLVFVLNSGDQPKVVSSNIEDGVNFVSYSHPVRTWVRLSDLIQALPARLARRPKPSIKTGLDSVVLPRRFSQCLPADDVHSAESENAFLMAFTRMHPRL